MNSKTYKWCVVPQCTNTSIKTPAKLFIYVPNSATIRKKWLHLARRDPTQLSTKSSIYFCEDHFDLPKDMENYIEYVIMGSVQKIRMKPGCLPLKFECQSDQNKRSSATSTPRSAAIKRQRLTLNKKCTTDDTLNDDSLARGTACPSILNTDDSSRMNRQIKRKNKKVIAELSADADAEETTSVKINEFNEIETKPIEIIHIDWQTMSEVKDNEIRMLKQQLCEETRLVKHLREEIESVRIQNTTIREKTLEEFKERMYPTLTPTQIDFILKKKTQNCWSVEDKLRGISLRYLGKRNYEYIRNHLKYPLPSLSALRKWKSTMQFKDGLLKSVISIIKIAGLSKSEVQRVCVLTCDAIRVRSLFEFDMKSNKTVGPHKSMFVMMIRGLFDSYKQPVYVDFDVSLTASLLIEVLNALSDAGYDVVACVADRQDGNRRLWDQLNVSAEKPYFGHPKNPHKVYMFPDSSHVYISIRNWLLDTGFILPSGHKITKDPLIKLVNATRDKQGNSFKLKEEHITCERSERKDVRLTTELISHSTSTALKRYFPEDNEAQNLASFLKLTYDWFDVMNWKTNTDLVFQPYGIKLEEQNKILVDMHETIKNIKCFKVESLRDDDDVQVQAFQVELSMGIHALRLLFEDMKKKYNIGFINTNTLNLDALKNLFAQLRDGDGADDHPTPLTVLHRLQMIFFEKPAPSTKTDANSSGHSDCTKEEFLLNHVINESDLKLVVAQTTKSSDLEDNSETEKANPDSVLPVAGIDSVKIKTEEEWIGY